MTTLVKDGVEITMPPMDKNTKLNMERCADFLARMIQKYGRDVLEAIQAEGNECTNINEN